MGGLSILRQLGSQGIEVPIAILTTSNDEEDLVSALRGGARGYLLKDMAPDALVAAIETIVAGETVVAPELAPILATAVRGGYSGSDSRTRLGRLTSRETDIISLLAEGQSNKLIAHNLGISEGTVKLHVKAVLRKLGVHSRVEAAVLAVENGMRARRSSIR
jgi:two-component system nitrate/nitrite response regulator NarL